MTTNQKGAIAVAKIAARLIELGERVLIPFGCIGRYDLALDRSARLVRIKCKHARFSDGCVVFDTATHGGYGNKPRKAYHKDADYFAIWCSNTGLIYMVRVEDAAKGEMRLRVDPPKKQANRKNIRWAAHFMI